jgi:hypothetical protein
VGAVVRTDLKGGDKLLLPVTALELVGWPGGDAHAVMVQTVGDDYFKLYPEDVEVLIPANRLTDIEAENARLREALNFFVNDDRFIVQVGGNPRAVEAMIKRVSDILNTGDNQ